MWWCRQWRSSSSAPMCVRSGVSEVLGDLGPAELGVRTGDRLQEDHTRRVGREPVRGTGWQQRHMAAAGDDPAHPSTVGLAVECNRAAGVRLDWALLELDEADFD